MDKEQKAIERIKMASEMSLQHYGRPLVCTYSGGKDSDDNQLYTLCLAVRVHEIHPVYDIPSVVHPPLDGMKVQKERIERALR